MRSLRALSLIILLSVSLIVSCAGKKGATTASGKEAGKAPGSETMTSEQTTQESSDASQAGSSLQDQSQTSLSSIERIYFDFDDANLRSDARDTLKKDSDILKANPNTSIQIEGHCDERGSSEYNLALGERRAESIKKYLATLGISNQKMSTISYGEEKPLVEGHNEDAWSKNRRGEIVPK